MTKSEEYRERVNRINKEHADKQRRNAEANGTALVKIKEIKAGVSPDQWEDPYVHVVPENPNHPDYYMTGVAITDPDDIAFELTLEKAQKIVEEAKKSGVINRYDYSPHYVYGSQAYVNEGLEEFAILADKTGDNSWLDY